MPARPLTRREAEVISEMTRASKTEVDVKDLRVASIGGCGCPTVYFVQAPRDPGIEQIAVASITDSLDVVILYRASYGELDSMEYLPISGDAPPYQFPAPTTLRPSES